VRWRRGWDSGANGANQSGRLGCRTEMWAGIDILLERGAGAMRRRLLHAAPAVVLERERALTRRVWDRRGRSESGLPHPVHRRRPSSIRRARRGSPTTPASSCCLACRIVHRRRPAFGRRRRHSARYIQIAELQRRRVAQRSEPQDNLPHGWLWPHMSSVRLGMSSEVADGRQSPGAATTTIRLGALLLSGDILRQGECLERDEIIPIAGAHEQSRRVLVAAEIERAPLLAVEARDLSGVEHQTNACW